MHLKDLIKCHRPEILPAITEQQCPGHYSWFIAQLVKISPVSSLVPSDSIALVRALLERQLTADEIKELSLKAPLMFRLHCEGSITERWVRDTVQSQIDLASLVDAATAHATDPPAVDNSNIGAYFPRLPAGGSRGSYSVDKGTSLETLCSKNAPHHGTMLPGIFTLHCQHSKL